MHGHELNWVTRSGRLFPLEYAKLYDTLYAQSLDGEPRARLLTPMEPQGARYDPETGRRTLEAAPR